MRKSIGLLLAGSVERHFGVRFAFQSCHPAAAVPGAAYRAFVSPRSQVLNQTPGLRHR